MKTKSKALLLSLCAVMLVAASIFGTLAYLTDTDAVENTFTVGQVGISLDEAKVNTKGEKLDNGGNVWVEGATLADRVQANEYKLVPGHEYIKDPTVHVDKGSEDSWLFIKVDNGIAAIEDSTNTIADQMKAIGWTPVDGITNVYAYKEVVKAEQDVVVFNRFKISGDVEGTKPETPEDGVLYLSDYVDAVINVTAYAVQADGFGNAADAWKAAFGA